MQFQIQFAVHYTRLSPAFAMHYDVLCIMGSCIMRLSTVSASATATEDQSCGFIRPHAIGTQIRPSAQPAGPAIDKDGRTACMGQPLV